MTAKHPLAGFRLTDPCPCDSGQPYAQCCAPVHRDIRQAERAEQLMRARYSACALLNEDFMMTSWHPKTCPFTLALDSHTRWIGLEVKHTEDGGKDDEHGIVEFVARYKINGRAGRMRERSRFGRHNGHWVYIDGEVQAD